MYGSSVGRRQYNVERRAAIKRGDRYEQERRNRSGWVVPNRHEDWLAHQQYSNRPYDEPQYSNEQYTEEDEGEEYGEGEYYSEDDLQSEASGAPPEYGLPPHQVEQNIFGPSRNNLRSRIGSILGSRKYPARADTPRQPSLRYQRSIHSLGGRQAADPVRNINMGGGFLADIPRGSELFLDQYPNRVAKKSGQARDKGRRALPERQTRGARSTMGSLVRRTRALLGSRNRVNKRKLPTLPPAFKHELRARMLNRWAVPALRYYLEQFQGRDEPLPTRPNDLEELLQDKALTLEEDQPRQTWTAKKSLGKGGYGEVVLWQRQLPNGTVEQIAVKNTSFHPFFKDYSAEGHLTRRLNAAGCTNVIHVYDWQALEQQRCVRIAYEFCPMGDLMDLADWYHGHKYVCR